MSSEKTYSPSQAGQLIDVHPNTIRKWIDEFGDVLSESARSRPRLLRESDVATLALAKQMRDEGLSVADTLERLRQIPASERHAPTIDAPTTPTDASTTPTVDSTHLPAPVDVAAIVAGIAHAVEDRTDERLRQIDERLTQVERGRSVWSGVALGLALGILLGVILAAILLRL